MDVPTETTAAGLTVSGRGSERVSPVTGRKFAPEVGLAVTSIIATLVAVAIERRGVISTSDGIVYTGAATNFAGGEGLTVPFSGYTDHFAPAEAVALGNQVPLAHWPPLYPSVLATMRVLGLSATAAASVLNPLLLGLNVYLLGRLARRLFATHWAALFGAALLLVTFRDPDLGTSSLVILHATTLSEPLFTTLTLTTLLLVDRYRSAGGDHWYWAAAFVASLTVATKFNGAPLVLVVAVVGALRGSARQRLLKSIGTLMGALPSAYWLQRARDGRLASPPDGLSIAFTELRIALSEMFVPSSWPSVVRVVVLGATVALVFAGVAWAWSRADGRPALVRLMPTFAVAVLMTLQLIYARGFLDQHVGVNGRQLAVVHLLIVVLLLAVAGLVGTNQAHRRVMVGCVGIWVLIAAVGGATSFMRFVVDPITPGDHQQVVRAIATVPDDHVLFTNTPDVVFEVTGRSSHMLPCRTNFFSGAERPSYEGELEQLLQLIRDRKASVVLVSGVMGRPSECGASMPFDGQPGIRTDPGRSGPIIIRPDE